MRKQEYLCPIPVGPFIAFMINFSVVKKLLIYNYTRQIMDIFKYACLALCGVCSTSLIMNIFSLNNLFYLLVFTLIFCLIYMLLSIVFKVKAANYVRSMFGN